MAAAGQTRVQQSPIKNRLPTLDRHNYRSLSFRHFQRAGDDVFQFGRGAVTLPDDLAVLINYECVGDAAYAVVFERAAFQADGATFIYLTRALMGGPFRDSQWPWYFLKCSKIMPEYSGRFSWNQSASPARQRSAVVTGQVPPVWKY